MDRRDFLKVIGASGAAAAASGCSSGGQERLIPYLIPIEDLQPGVSTEYSTVCRECPAGCGMVARVRDGRVHKVEGNPDHPINRGALCLRGQTALQDVYNPDRIRQPLARDSFGRLQPISWEEGERRLLDALDGAQAGRTVWMGRVETGAFDRLVDRWLAAVAPRHTRLRYEPLADEPLRAAHARVFGRAGLPELRIAEARMLLCFGADFLETWISNVEYARAFSAWRQARVRGPHADRRYVFMAPRLSLTGANADEWIPIRPGTEALIARALTAVVTAERNPAARPDGQVAARAEAAGVPLATLQRLGKEFAAALPSLALPVGVAGTGERATAANEAILRLNQVAGNIGRTYLVDRPHALETASPHREVAASIAAMHAGDVSLLLLHEANPAYHLPPAMKVAEAIARVPAAISFSSHLDETTALAHLVLPDHRPLEAWGEYSPRPGITGLLQPVIMPVFDTRPTGDLLLTIAARRGHDLGAPDFQTYLRKHHGAGDAGWTAAVQRGGIFAAAAHGLGPDAKPSDLREPVPPPAARVPDAAVDRSVASPLQRGSLPVDTGFTPWPAVPAQPPGTPSTAGVSEVDPQPVFPPAAAEGNPPRLTLYLHPSLHCYDGRTANRPWAQEIPDPMARAVWGSWAEIHPETARRLGAGSDDVLVLTTEAGRLEVPALVTEGVHPEVVAIQLGQGHTAYGRYARGTGVNPISLLSGTTEQASGALILSNVPVNVLRSAVRRPVVILQTSQRLTGDDVARETTLTELARVPSTNSAAAEEEARPALYRYRPQSRHHWGMAIDLDRCIGCNACAAACYAENNVPIVGRDECARGREMAWLRIENYTEAAPTSHASGSGAADPPHSALSTQPLSIRFLPMLCQQCDNAPCEYVCPVYASVHSSDGLNQQVYNRCVGTRFCANNCPYQVRRFNWFTYDFPAPLDQQLNPDVIHRTKGVMEKCTFCVQRIRRARIDAAAAGRPVRDGEIMTACQQTCPTDAIAFGDLNDPNSRVRRLAAGPRGYGALSHLNTFPNVTYLARVRAEASG